MLDPDMPRQELLFHTGEMTAQEIRTARAAIRWANSAINPIIEKLERIARLGSEPFYGNSKGNILAQECLVMLGAGDIGAEWNEWRGGEPPVQSDEPVRIWWPNGITRTYERGDHIVWNNLQTDGSVKWRKP